MRRQLGSTSTTAAATTCGNRSRTVAEWQGSVGLEARREYGSRSLQHASLARIVVHLLLLLLLLHVLHMLLLVLLLQALLRLLLHVHHAVRVLLLMLMLVLLLLLLLLLLLHVALHLRGLHLHLLLLVAHHQTMLLQVMVATHQRLAQTEQLLVIAAAIEHRITAARCHRRCARRRSDHRGVCWRHGTCRRQTCGG